MTKRIFFPTTLLLLFVALLACNRLDKEVAAAASAETTKVQGLTPAIDETIQKFEALAKHYQEKFPPETFAKTETADSEMMQLGERIPMMLEKVKAIKKENDETVQMLQSIPAQISEGKLSNEEGKAQIEKLSADMTNITDQLTRMSERASALMTQIDEAAAKKQ